MAIVTLLSDFGYKDHYVAALKAKIYAFGSPDTRIVDISHHISLCDISQAAFTLGAVFRDFPQGSIHLASVNSGIVPPVYVALRLEGHYFVGFGDTGLWGLISKEQPTSIVSLSVPNKEKISVTFPERDILAAAAGKLAGGEDINSLGEPCAIQQTFTPTLPVRNGNVLVGHVIHVDHYGNIITDITREIFKNFVGERKFIVRFGQEKTNYINAFSYYEKGDGLAFVIFNSLGLLELGVNKGQADRLLMNLSNNQLISIALTE